MEQQIKVSIIVPVFKVEEYLNQCIDSIIAQTYYNIEIILVDDGSPDKCPLICNEYSESDSRVIVIHKVNEGVASARNTGLSKSTGDYILYVDADDYIEPDMVEKMVTHAESQSADIVISGYKECNGEKIIPMANSFHSGTYKGQQLQLLKDTLFFSGKFYIPSVIPAVWNKLIRKTLLSDFQYTIPASIVMGEDAALTYTALFKSGCVVIDNELKPYNYRFVLDSLSKTYKPNFFSMTFDLFAYLDSIFAGTDTEKSLCYYKLFMLLWGSNSFLFKEKSHNFLKKNMYLRKQMKQYEIPSFLPSIDVKKLSPIERTFLAALRKNTFLKYIVQYCLLYIKQKIVTYDS